MGPTEIRRQGIHEIGLILEFTALDSTSRDLDGTIDILHDDDWLFGVVLGRSGLLLSLSRRTSSLGIAIDDDRTSRRLGRPCRGLLCFQSSWGRFLEKKNKLLEKRNKEKRKSHTAGGARFSTLTVVEDASLAEALAALIGTGLGRAGPFATGPLVEAPFSFLTWQRSI